MPTSRPTRATKQRRFRSSCASTATSQFAEPGPKPPAISSAPTEMSVAEVLLRGLTAGVMLAVSIGFVAADHDSQRATRPVRWSGASFCLAVAAFAVHSGGAETQALGILRVPVWLLSAGGIGYFWLFATILFEDR